MELQDLISEYAGGGIRELLYREILGTVRSVALGHRYPLSYSPTGRWDEDAFTALAHDWAMNKLIRHGQLEHLLLSNQSLRTFRKGLELSFKDYLISQKKRTILGNLFQRANRLLESDERFRVFIDTRSKASRLWGLSSWQNPQPFQGSEALLIAAGYQLPEFPVIRYRPDARRLAPVISGRNLAEFVFALLTHIQSLLSLEHMLVVFRYRFNLLGDFEVSLDEPVITDQEGRNILRRDTVGTDGQIEDEIIARDTASAVIRDLTPRQRAVLKEYVVPGATLASVAERVGYSKSTVDNDLHAALRILELHTGTAEEARAVFDQVIDELMSDRDVGNSAV